MVLTPLLFEAPMMWLLECETHHQPQNVRNAKPLLGCGCPVKALWAQAPGPSPGTMGEPCVKQG